MKRVVSVEPTHDEIARLAYHLFEEGGGNTVTTSNTGCKRKPTYARTPNMLALPPKSSANPMSPENTYPAGVQKLLFFHSANPLPPGRSRLISVR
jgi:hypothetical protein